LRFSYWLWLFAVQASWAASYVAMKAAGGEMPVGAVVFLRYGLASLLFSFGGYWTGLPRIAVRDLFWLGLLGAANFALAPTLQVTSLRYTQAIDVSILIALEPLLTVVLAALALGERPTRTTLGALFAGTLGMIVLSGVGFQGASPELTRARLFGNLLFVASLLCEAAVTVAGGKYKDRYSPAHVIWFMKLAGFLTAAAVYAPVVAATDFNAISARGWSSVVFLAVFPSIFSYTSWYWIIRTVPVNQVALSLFFQPLAGTVLGYWLLDETLGWRTFAGAVLLCSSLAWWQTRTIGGKAKAAAAPPTP